MGQNCPYYDLIGYTEARVTGKGDTIEIEGPYEEIYSKQTPSARTEPSPTSTSPVPEVDVDGGDQVEGGRNL